MISLPETFSLKTLTAYFKKYAACYESFDVTTLCSYFSFPSCIVHEQSVTAFTTKEEILENMTKLLDIYKKRGFGHAEFTILNTVVFGKNHALVTLEWVLLDKKNCTLDLFRCNYQLINQNGMIKIVVVTNLEEVEHTQVC